MANFLSTIPVTVLLASKYNLLKKQGLSGKAREIIFQALIISRLSYALPSFVGFLSCLHVARFNAFFRKSFRWGLIDRIFLF